jgi:hypothetical protein
MKKKSAVENGFRGEEFPAKVAGGPLEKWPKSGRVAHFLASLKRR